MEKKYCVHCRRFIMGESICEGCGKDHFKDIVISVQAQPDHFKNNKR